MGPDPFLTLGREYCVRRRESRARRTGGRPQRPCPCPCPCSGEDEGANAVGMSTCPAMCCRREHSTGGGGERKGKRRGERGGEEKEGRQKGGPSSWKYPEAKAEPSAHSTDTASTRCADRVPIIQPFGWSDMRWQGRAPEQWSGDSARHEANSTVASVRPKRQAQASGPTVRPDRQAQRSGRGRRTPWQSRSTLNWRAYFTRRASPPAPLPTAVSCRGTTRASTWHTTGTAQPSQHTSPQAHLRHIMGKEQPPAGAKLYIT